MILRGTNGSRGRLYGPTRRQDEVLGSSAGPFRVDDALSQPVGKKFRAMRFQATFSTASANCGHSKGRRRMSPRFTSADTIEMHYAKIGVTVASYRHRHIQEIFNIFRARPYLKLLIWYCPEARAPNSLASLH